MICPTRIEVERLAAMCDLVVADAQQSRRALDALSAHIECMTTVLQEMRAGHGARIAELKQNVGAS